MVKGTIRALWVCALSTLFAIGLSGTADAACNCFCKVHTDFGGDPGPNMPNFLIQYNGLPSWANCTFGTTAKKSTCKGVCKAKALSDSAQYGSDQWLCNKIGANNTANVVAYAAIGNGNDYEAVVAKGLSCKKCMGCPTGSNYNATLNRCLVSAPPPYQVAGMPNGAYGAWCAWNGLLYACTIGAVQMVVGTSC